MVISDRRILTPTSIPNRSISISKLLNVVTHSKTRFSIQDIVLSPVNFQHSLITPVAGVDIMKWACFIKAYVCKNVQYRA